MDHISMFILGAVQGAAEFLPVSSSGHLALAKYLMKDAAAISALREAPLLLDILLHLATLAAVLIFFRRKIGEAILGAGRLLRSLFTGTVSSCLREDNGALIALCVCVATVPTAIMGVLLKGAAETAGGSPTLLGITFLICAGILIWTRFVSGGSNRISLITALLIGIAQGAAVMPGISRSGMTIAVALALGLTRRDAFSFSFLLSIPAILGAAVLEMDFEKLSAGGHIGSFVLGATAAFIVGFAALYLLGQVVDKGRLWWFAPYVGAVGILSLVLGAA